MTSWILRKPLNVVYVTEGFGHSRGDRLHAGLDMRAAVGTPVFATSSGTVLFAGDYNDGSGKAIELDHLDGMASRYLHLSRIDVHRGASVRSGQQIGLTGFATSPHLHFDVWVTRGQVDEYVNRFGMPKGGITQSRAFAGAVRFKVPAEPLVPADGYQPDVLAMMAAFGIQKPPLWANKTQFLLAGALLIGGALVYRRVARATDWF